MATEYPPLGKSFVLSYSNNDRDYPIIAIRKDPRVENYKIPDDLSPHPDSKRYTNHVFTGAQPTNSDERVQWIYEILPAPWVPFTRYDDDLGPIQGRRRFVKNEGQQASLTSSVKTSYEGREGSAIVSTEIEETWSIKVDDDGNSLFPIKDRDFYDASRGAVQERRQLFVPTGEEVGTLENINGAITQTSYEPYNEFLSVKIVQTYSVDGPQLIGKATDNDGQLVNITTQRKGTLGYVPPNPTATRTVEVAPEDIESLVEKIVDTPEIFKATTFSIERPDPIPQKFRVAVPLNSSQEIVEGIAEIPKLAEGDISKSEEQRNKFIKRVSSASRDQTVLPKTFVQKGTNNERQEVTITETLQEGNTSETPNATTTIESDALGDGNYVIRKTQVSNVFPARVFQSSKVDLTPQKFRAKQQETIEEISFAGTAAQPTLVSGEFSRSSQQVNAFVARTSVTKRNIKETLTLTESILTPDGQVGSRKLTLSGSAQTFTPSAKLIEASVEDLGDGRTVLTETKVEKVFDEKVKTLRQGTQLPSKFVSGQTSESNILEGTTAVPTTLGAFGQGVVESTAQRITEQKVKNTTSSVSLRNNLQSKVFTRDLGGGIANVVETVGEDVSAAFGTISAESENLGDVIITKQIKLGSIPTLSGQEYDDVLDITIPYTEEFIKGGTVGTPSAVITPRDVYHSQEKIIDIVATQEKYLNSVFVLDEIVNISLPDVLTNVSIVPTPSEGGENTTSTGNSCSATATASASYDLAVGFSIRNGYSGPAEARKYIFFILASPDYNFAQSETGIYNKVRRIAGEGSIKPWPIYQTETNTFTTIIQSERVSATASVSLPKNKSKSISVDRSSNVQSYNVPQTLHEFIPLQVPQNPFVVTKIATAEGDLVGSVTVEAIAKAQCYLIGAIHPTSPTQVQTGTFFYSINSQPYRFGLVRCEVVVVDVTGDMV